MSPLDALAVGLAPSSVTVGAALRMEHSLDPGTEQVLRDLRSGTPALYAVGGAIAGAAGLGVALWAARRAGYLG